MGLGTKRTNNFLTEYLGVSWPTRYQNFREERHQARSGNPLERSFYLRGSHVIAGLLGALVVLV